MDTEDDHSRQMDGPARRKEDVFRDLSRIPTPAEMHAAMSTLLRDLGLPDNLVELEVLEFRRELTDETDRGVALYAAAHLDDRLATMLRMFFVQDEPVVEPLFRGMGPFATFSARIDTAYLLGLIPVSVRRELHLVRKVRNDFRARGKTGAIR